MKKFILKTMGCKSNQLEGFLIEENLLKNNFQKAERITDADFFILNSCTVTHKSDSEAFSILKRAKRENPSLKTVLTGCIAQIEKEKLLTTPDVDYVFGNDEKLTLSEFLSNGLNLRVKDIQEVSKFNKVLLQNTGKTRAGLKIQDGCDNRCSYCVIPFARGKNRSADLDFILRQIDIYEQAGFKEVVLTGIHIGQWGADFKNEESLLHLLKNIEEKTSIPRFRLGSLNPTEISGEMLEFLKNSRKFCPHFHLSLQSMCDKTLESMNRHYSVEQAIDLIERISETFNLPFIGSDIITGFPGESEEDFAITVQNILKSKLTQIHTFPYSLRKGTVAFDLPLQIDTKEKEHRASIIKKISAQKHKDFLQNNLNTFHEVIIEKNIDKKTGFYKGVSENYISVLIRPDLDFGLVKNTIQNVKIINVSEKVFAEIS